MPTINPDYKYQGFFFFTNQTTDGVSVTYRIQQQKPYTIYCYGLLDGATVTPQWSPDNGASWINFTANSQPVNFSTILPAQQYFLDLMPGTLLRGVIILAGASTDITLEIK